MTDFRGHVRDAGGGEVVIVVDRETENYPIPGQKVAVLVWPRDSTIERAIEAITKFRDETAPAAVWYGLEGGRKYSPRRVVEPFLAELLDILTPAVHQETARLGDEQ